MANRFSQPTGPVLPDWRPPSLPPRAILSGSYCQIEPLQPDLHAADLSTAWADDGEGLDWTYMAFGPFDSSGAFREWADEWSQKEDTLYYAIVDTATQLPTGIVSYLRMDPSNGSIEVGGIVYSGRLKRSRAATEVIFLLAQNVFELGYRRLEWKCDSLNAPSRRAALRLGFSFEGLFRQAVVYKGRNRDTAWYSILDGDWPELRRAYQRWLDPGNFDGSGKQKSALSELTRPLVRKEIKDLASGR